MKTVMFSCRLPVELIDAIKALQAKHGFNSQSEVLAAAVSCFIDVPVNDSAALADKVLALESQQSELLAALNALNDRVVAIEQSGNSQVAPAIKTRPQHDLAPLQELVGVAPDDKDDALLWAADLIQRGAALKDVNSALLSKGFVGKNPSRLKDKLISLGLLDNDGGGGGGDELQTELTVKSHCE